MDNREISIKSKGRTAFDLAFQLMFDNAAGGKATHYQELPGKGLVFFWSESSKASKLPYKMDWKAASDLAWGWLSEQPDSAYEGKIDFDGSLGKGSHVYNEAWGRIEGTSYGFLAVKPMWAWFGK